MIAIINFANENNFTHVRLVADLLMPHRIDMYETQSILSQTVDDTKVVYQSRDNPSQGGDCYICYLKPIISADCKIYACCGAQYALKEPSKHMPEELCMGHAYDLGKIIADSNKPFDGRVCHRCYYSGYNKILKNMLTHTDHSKFL